MVIAIVSYLVLVALAVANCVKDIRSGSTLADLKAPTMRAFIPLSFVPVVIASLSGAFAGNFVLAGIVAGVFTLVSILLVSRLCLLIASKIA